MNGYIDTLFKDLPNGLPPNELAKIVEEFKRDDYTNRQKFITAYTKLATSVAVKYGYNYACHDELLDVALIELCEYPKRAKDAKSQKIISHLLNRIQTACKDQARRLSLVVVPWASLVHCNKTKINRVKYPDDNDVENKNLYNKFFIDSVNDNGLECSYDDLYEFVVIERERMYLDWVRQGYRDREICKMLGVSQTTVKRIFEGIKQRFILHRNQSMQTFLPYPDFEKSAQCLDSKRLGKQRAECVQLLLKQFPNHLATKMWDGYEYQLAEYGIAICLEYESRGYKDNTLDKIADIQSRYTDTGLPLWFGDNRLHASHRSNLLRKNYEHYSAFDWKEPPNLEYYWPIK